MKHLKRLGQYWPKYLPFAMYSCNTFFGPNLNGFSPNELVFRRNPNCLLTHCVRDRSKCESIGNF